jgi:hypothetical protein
MCVAKSAKRSFQTRERGFCSRAELGQLLNDVSNASVSGCDQSIPRTLRVSGGRLIRWNLSVVINWIDRVLQRRESFAFSPPGQNPLRNRNRERGGFSDLLTRGRFLPNALIYRVILNKTESARTALGRNAGRNGVLC